MRTIRVVAVAAVFLLFVVGPARAEFADGRAAYERGEYEVALAAWKPLAEQGDRDAQRWLGILHEKGQGVDRDLAEAHKWYVLSWKRQVPAARRSALALRKQMSTGQLEDSRKRIRAWLDRFEAAGPVKADSAPGDAKTLYRQVHALTRSPPDNRRLKTLCSARVDDFHVTFVTADRKHVLLVSLTERPLRDASKDILLAWKLVGRGASRGGSDSATMDWAYVYDRNRDGRVDYLAYLVGPAAVIPEPRPEVLPNMAGGSMSGKQLMYSMRNTHQVFWHLADDDFDGKPDAYAVPTRDLRSGWVDGYVFAHSSRFDGDFDQCRFIPTAAKTPVATCRRVGRKYTVPEKSYLGPSEVPLGNDLPLLTWINRAARQCGLTSRHFHGGYAEGQ